MCWASTESADSATRLLEPENVGKTSTVFQQSWQYRDPNAAGPLAPWRSTASVHSVIWSEPDDPEASNEGHMPTFHDFSNLDGWSASAVPHSRFVMVRWSF